MPDASNVSLAPTIVGGLLAIGGVLVGVAGSVIVFLFQSRAEKKKRRAEKFEELVAAVYEHDHWIDSLRRIYVLEFQGEIKVSPFAKVHAISDIYFPRFAEAVEQLGTAAKAYRMWMYEVAQHKPENAKLMAGHQEAVTPYKEKQDALLAALKAFAPREFQ